MWHILLNQKTNLYASNAMEDPATKALGDGGLMYSITHPSELSPIVVQNIPLIWLFYLMKE
jgi:hypothetical protein